MVAVDSKGLLFGAEWFEAKEIWSWGWKSLVATLIANGSARRSLIMGTMSRPPSTARAPFCDYQWLRLGLVLARSYRWAEVFLNVDNNERWREGHAVGKSAWE
jgi:hypothetical protein